MNGETQPCDAQEGFAMEPLPNIHNEIVDQSRGEDHWKGERL